MKGIFMRVWFCKIHCPSFICFFKPSTASHLYSSNTLKLENSHHAPQTSVVVTYHQS
ncbi:putative light-harvesting complex-like protein OHP2 [Helianthus annuus]|nr:putative light-harvesting complex-like protein OHP2 [Helianthus annuus]KAJ0845896.1 putative light-harvesting complex-like protein OHP2 [Helianthus annuus]